MRSRSSATPSAAIDSYRTFARLKRDGGSRAAAASGLAADAARAVSAFVALEDQAGWSRAYEAAMSKEVERILAADPARPARDPVGRALRVRDARGRRSRSGSTTCGRHPRAPAGSPAGSAGRRARLPPLLRRRRARPLRRPPDAGKLVGVANALAAGSTGRSTGSTCRVPAERDDATSLAPLATCGSGRETELYLGLIHPDDRRRGRSGGSPPRRELVALRRRHRVRLGRGGRRGVPELIAAHRALSARSRPTPAPRLRVRLAGGFRPGARRGLDDATSTSRPRLRPRRRPRLVPQPRPHRRGARRRLRDGDLLLDYSGGTGILLDRLGCGCSTAGSAW